MGGQYIMFCKKCGKPINESDVFCKACGAKNKSAVVENKVDQEATVEIASADTCPNCGAALKENDEFCPTCSKRIKEEAPAQSEPAEENVQTVEPAQEVQPAVDVKDAEPVIAKKKTFNKKQIVVSAIVVIALIVSAFAFIPALKNGVVKLFSSPEAYLQRVLTKSSDTMIDNFAQLYGRGLEYMNDGVTSKAEWDIQLDKNYTETLEDFIDEDIDEIKEYIDWLKNISLKVESTVKDNKVAGYTDISLNKVNLGKINIAQDQADGSIYMALPDYASKYLLIENYYNIIYGVAVETSSTNELMKALPKEKAVKKLAKKYLGIVVDCIDDVKQTTEQISAEDVAQNVTVLSFDVDGELIADITKNVITEFKKDKELQKIIREILTAAAEGYEDDVDEAMEQLMESADSTLESIEAMDKDELEYMDEMYDITIDVYVNNAGELVGFKLKSGEIKLKMYTTMKGSKFGSKYEYDDGMNSLGIYASGKQSGSKRTGTYEIKGMGIPFVNVEVKNLNLDLLSKGVFNGTMTIKLADGIDNLIGQSMYDAPDFISNLSDLSLVIKSDTSSYKQSKAELALKFEDNAIFTIKSSTKISGAKNVKLPSGETVDISDMDELEEYLGDFKINDLIKKLRKAGAPDDLIEPIEDSFDDLF